MARWEKPYPVGETRASFISGKWSGWFCGWVWKERIKAVYLTWHHPLKVADISSNILKQTLAGWGPSACTWVSPLALFIPTTWWFSSVMCVCAISNNSSFVISYWKEQWPRLSLKCGAVMVRKPWPHERESIWAWGSSSGFPASVIKVPVSWELVAFCVPAHRCQAFQPVSLKKTCIACEVINLVRAMALTFTP